MSQVKLKGNAVSLEGELPSLNQKVPDFTLIDPKLSEITLTAFQNKVGVILAIPSLDTPVCAKETRIFSEKLNNKSNALLLVASGDLPFAMQRYCTTEGLENVKVGSQYRDMNFSRSYGVHIADGPLQGLTARAVFVIDKDQVLRYLELVEDISSEPNYNRALEEVEKLL